MNTLEFFMLCLIIILVGTFLILTAMFYAVPEEGREGVIREIKCNLDNCHEPVKYSAPANLPSVNR